MPTFARICQNFKHTYLTLTTLENSHETSITFFTDFADAKYGLRI